jgi:hypothetical protein
LSEVFTVQYHFQNWDGNKWADFHEGRNLTWAQIFAAVGPRFYRPAAAKLIGYALMEYLQEKEKIKPHNMRIFGSDEDQIKIQLMALGLIEIQPMAEAGGGGIAEFASLTPQGQKQLLELLAVPRRSPG